MKLLIRSDRISSHSVAMVNKYQLLEFAKITGLSLVHDDVGSMPQIRINDLRPADQLRIAAIPSLSLQADGDYIADYRMAGDKWNPAQKIQARLLSGGGNLLLCNRDGTRRLGVSSNQRVH